MPFKSPKQRRFIYSEAGKGVGWAKKFVKDAEGEKPKKHRKKK